MSDQNGQPAQAGSEQAQTIQEGSNNTQQSAGIETKVYESQISEMQKKLEKFEKDNFEYRERERKRKEEDAKKTGKWEEVYNESQNQVIELKTKLDSSQNQIKTLKNQVKSVLDARLSSLSPEKKEMIENTFKSAGIEDPIQKNALLESMLKMNETQGSGTPLSVGQPVGMTGNNTDILVQKLSQINASNDRAQQAGARSELDDITKAFLQSK